MEIRTFPLMALLAVAAAALSGLRRLLLALAIAVPISAQTATLSPNA